MADTNPRFNVLTSTASELQSLLSAGKITTVEIVISYLDQIERHNHAGAKLNAVINIIERDVGLAKARKLDEERKNGKVRGELHGLPIVIKDCFAFGEGMGLSCTGGAKAFEGSVGRENAGIVRQLEDAGLIVIATANMTEFCGHKCEKMTPGWSALGGQTQSAWDRERKPGVGFGAPCGGSSSGSGVCLSAGFAPLSIGTETGGSLVYPASKAGVYGMKPTWGSVSTAGAFRISRSFDGIGGMAKTPSDLASVIETILLPEAKAKHLKGGYDSSMTGSWEGLKVGVVESTWGGANAEKWGKGLLKEKYEEAISTMKAGGAKVLYPAHVPAPETVKWKEIGLHQVAFHEFNEVFPEFCKSFKDPTVKNLEELIEWNKEHKNIAMPPPHEDQIELINSFDTPANLSVADRDEALVNLRRLAGEGGMGKFMKENEIDLVVSNSDCSLVTFTACAGWPSGTVPLGRDEKGIPFGMFILARGGEERRILEFMSAWEKSKSRGVRVGVPDLEGIAAAIGMK